MSLVETVSDEPAIAPQHGRKDARAVKTDLALRKAMLALLERMPLDQVTVREIVSEAGVSYATFFRHHPSKEALLDHVAADQIDRLVDLTLPIFDAADSHAAIVALCRYVEDHRTVWTTLLTGGAAAAMRVELLRISREVAVARAPQRGTLPLELAVNYSVSLIFETLAWWLAQPAGTVRTDQLARPLSRLLSCIQDIESD
jgi:AcrR family transcriptional regulator